MFNRNESTIEWQKLLLICTGLVHRGRRNELEQLWSINYE